MRTAVFFILVSLSAQAAIDVENPLCDNLFLKGYLDARYTDFGEWNACPSREFSIRRAGVEVEADLTGNLMVQIKTEMRPSEVFLKDAFLQWAPLDFAEGRFGFFRTESSLGGGLSTWDLPGFERPMVYDLREELTCEGRDMGMDVSAGFETEELFALKGTAGVFNGEERGVDKEDNELLYSLRLEAEILPASLTMGISGVSQRQGMAYPEVPDGYISSQRLYSWSGDLQFHHDLSNWYSLELSGEYSLGDNWLLCDVLAGDDPPSYKGYWGAVTLKYHPWNIQGIRTVSFSAGYEELDQDTDLNLTDTRLFITGAVYPRENIRVRFGGIRNTDGQGMEDITTTDYILEAGFRF